MKQNELSGRLSATAIFAGVISTYGTMILLMLLGAGIGVWKFKFSEIPRLQLGFWIWSFASWIVSVVVGSRTAAFAARARTVRDGFLNAFTTWSASAILGCVILGVGTERAFYFTDSISSVLFFWAFVGNLIALTGAYYGAALGIRSEMRTEEDERSMSRDTEIKRFGRERGVSSL